MTSRGEVLDKVRVDIGAAAFAAEIAKADENPEVVLEATYGWYWPLMCSLSAAPRCIWPTRWG